MNEDGLTTITLTYSKSGVAHAHKVHELAILRTAGVELTTENELEYQGGLMAHGKVVINAIVEATGK